MIRKNRKTIAGYILLSVICYLITACNSQKKELQEKVEKLQQTAINIPYDRMACWTSDSIKAISPWNKAKLKLIHYVDADMCSTCYLQKTAKDAFFVRMESLSNNDFYNVFIITPNSKARKSLEIDFQDKAIPQTIFLDTANVFMDVNPNIPSESIYHTFLLDENNKVILVGNPVLNKDVGKMMLSVVEKKLGKKLNVIISDKQDNE